MAQLHLLAGTDRTLVIVDMQPRFASSQKNSTIIAVQRQIRKAMRNGWAVLFVEFSGYGQTDRRLTSVCEHYDRKATTVKCCDDGSDEVMSICRELNFPTDYFRVCGVNTGACVARTVSGLVYQGPMSVEVIKNACNQPAEWRRRGPSSKQTFENMAARGVNLLAA